MSDGELSKLANSLKKKKSTISQKRNRKSSSSTGKQSGFTFQDVSIQQFSGDDFKSVESWLNDFEEMSEILNWTNLQMLVYGKRSLSGIQQNR